VRSTTISIRRQPATLTLVRVRSDFAGWTLAYHRRTFIFYVSLSRREGPAVWLPAQASLTLTLCLHELATNAVKYGALSNGSGQVRLAWEPVDEFDRPKIRFTWQEIGGPPVAAPERKGFGSRLIASSGEGESAVEYRADGVRCLLQLAL
jgi:two-component sensor histidine kinase